MLPQSTLGINAAIATASRLFVFTPLPDLQSDIFHLLRLKRQVVSRAAHAAAATRIQPAASALGNRGGGKGGSQSHGRPFIHFSYLALEGAFEFLMPLIG